jgi:hypothetical protein
LRYAAAAVETLFAELKRYVGWTETDERHLLELHTSAAPSFERIADAHYDRIFAHDEAKKALVGGESSVGRLKTLLIAWMDRLLRGPWDEDYYQLRCRIGRVHVRIALPQHYMFGAMNVIRSELDRVIAQRYPDDPDRAAQTRDAVGKILDIELAIMLHTYREDLEAQQAKKERLATFGQLIGSIGHELRIRSASSSRRSTSFSNAPPLATSASASTSTASTSSCASPTASSPRCST